MLAAGAVLHHSILLSGENCRNSISILSHPTISIHIEIHYPPSPAKAVASRSTPQQTTALTDPASGNRRVPWPQSANNEAVETPCADSAPWIPLTNTPTRVPAVTQSPVGRRHWLHRYTACERSPTRVFRPAVHPASKAVSTSYRKRGAHPM